MKSILVIFAHPRLEKSRTNAALIKSISHLPHVTIRDLYEEYPEYNIDIRRERRWGRSAHWEETERDHKRGNAGPGRSVAPTA